MYIEGASLNAVSHDTLMLWVHIVTILAFVIVNSILIYFIIRYRKRSEHDITSAVDHHTGLEVAWTAIPTIIMAWLYVWGLVEFIKMRSIPANSMEISVRAQQWAWSFLYPSELQGEGEGGKRASLKTNNVLYLQDGQPTKLLMKSSDVLHSFFVPAFRVKEDVVPNMFTYAAFTPVLPENKKDQEEAVYDIFCTEYCGKDHSAMLGKAIILSPEKFRQKMKELAAEASNISPQRGEKLYLGNCKSCHSIDGARLIGPSLKGLWQSERILQKGEKVLADENYIRDSILYPNKQVVKGYPAAMPPQNYGDAEIYSVIEYIKTLK